MLCVGVSTGFLFLTASDLIWLNVVTLLHCFSLPFHVCSRGGTGVSLCTLYSESCCSGRVLSGLPPVEVPWPPKHDMTLYSDSCCSSGVLSRFPPVEAPPNCEVTLYSDSCCSSGVLSRFPPVEAPPNCEVTLYSDSCCSSGVLSRFPPVEAPPNCEVTLYSDSCHSSGVLSWLSPIEAPSVTPHSILILLFQRSFVWASTCWSATRPWCRSTCWRASLSSTTTASTTVSEAVTRYL